MKYISSIRSLMKDVKKDKPYSKTWQELAKIWAHYAVMFLIIFGGFMWIADKLFRPHITNNYYYEDKK